MGLVQSVEREGEILPVDSSRGSDLRVLAPPNACVTDRGPAQAAHSRHLLAMNPR